MNYETQIPGDQASHAAGERAEDELVETGAPSRRRLWIALAVGAIVLIAVAWFVFGGRGAPPPAQDSTPLVTVTVPGRTQVTRMISATGSLGARREMPIGVVGEGGMVTRVLVEPGAWVGAGQVLATIERSVQAQNIQSLAAQVQVARADARIAQQDLDRSNALLGRGFVSRADIDRKTATRDAAAARVDVAIAQMNQMRASTARLDIRAPAAGLVLTRGVEPGQVVGAGSGVLFRMAKGGEMEMLARVTESDLARLTVGAPAQVTPVGTTTHVAGRIWQISPVVDPQSRQGMVRIQLPYSNALRPGGFASTTIAAGVTEAPLLPESAVQSDDKGNFVYIVDAADKVVRRAVKVGEVSDAGVSVTSGLAGDERVVLSAGAFLNVGQKVRPERAAR